jgi:protein TonB
MNSPCIVFFRHHLEFAKLAPFLAASAALHALVFFCPLFDSPRGHERMIPVTIIELEQSLSGSAGTDSAEAPQKFPQRASAGNKNGGAPFYRPLNGVVQTEKSAPEGAPPQQPAPQASDARLAETAPPTVSADNPKLSNASSGTASSAVLASTISSGGAGWPGRNSGSGEESRRAAVSGQYGSGSAIENGYGSMHGVGFMQARYTETPQPRYPESARREGKEGRVLLRVLVDREGNSKNVEISGSSGSEILDRAAAETIKHWRFSPARYDDKPVESWVRIPIDFRLTDARNE